MSAIGVVTGQARFASAGNDSRGPDDIRIREGGIVGELALALNRPRTADLQAVDPTALLAINYQALRELIKAAGSGSLLPAAFDAFLRERILEHLYYSGEPGHRRDK